MSALLEWKAPDYALPQYGAAPATAIQSASAPPLPAATEPPTE